MRGSDFPLGSVKVTWTVWGGGPLEMTPNPDEVVEWLVALGAALAFGLGGRDAAARLLDESYRQTRGENSRAGRDAPARPTTPAHL